VKPVTVWEACILTLFLSIAGAAANLYVALKTGYSVPFAPLAAWSAASLFQRRQPSDVHTSTLVAISGGISSASYVPGGGNVPAFITVAMLSGIVPNRALWALTSTLWVALGIALAYLWQRHPRLDRKNAEGPESFPTATATADIIRAANSTAASGVFRPFGWGLGIGAFVAWLRCKPRVLGTGLPMRIPLGGSIGVDMSAMELGIGSYLGVRTAVSMAVTGLLMHTLVGPWLAAQHIIANPNIATVTTFAVWPAVGLVTGSACTSQLLAAVRLIERRRPPQTPRADSVSGLRWPKLRYHRSVRTIMIPIFLCGLASLLFVVLSPAPAARANRASLVVTTACIALMTLTIAVVSTRSMSATDAVPVKALAPLSQLVTAIVAPGALVSCAMAAHLACGTGLSAADTRTSFSALQRATLQAPLRANETGALHGIRYIALLRLLGAAAGAITTMLVLPLVIPNAVSFTPTPEVPAPSVVLWSSTTAILASGISALTHAARVCLLGGLVIGAFAALCESKFARTPPWWVPSVLASGGALVLPPSLSLTLLAGALLARLAQRWDHAAAARMTGVGAVAGESLGTISVMLLR
jgi:uncharacterized oligopeptide transporter (OPT) family protein